MPYILKYKNVNREWVIYKITSPSGRVYIGKSVNLKKRLLCYKGLQCKAQPMVYRSLKKYGYDTHKVEVIDRFIGDLSYANDKEMFWIRTYMSNVHKYPDRNGMNLTDGAEGLVGNVASQETRKKQSLARKGKTAWNKGKPMLPHNKEILRLANIGRPTWNKGKDYSYLSEEQKKIKFGKHNIGRTHNKGRKHTKEYAEAISKRKLGVPLVKKWKPILQYDLSGNFIKEHPSVKNTAVEVGISRSGLMKILSGEIKSPQSFIFKYKVA